MTYWPIVERDRWTKRVLQTLGYSDTRTMPPHTEYVTERTEVIFGKPIEIATGDRS